MHRRRVTCELHDSYFRLMTIQHAIQKIEWATEWALKNYITRSRQKSELQLQIGRSYRQDVVRKATPDRRGSGPMVEKMLIRCSKESHHPAEWASRPPVEHQENKKDTTLTAITVGSKYCSFCSVSNSLSHANLE